MIIMTPPDYTDHAFKQHLAREHPSNLFASYIKEIVYGGNDGIVTTFAVVAGFSGAYTTAHATLQMSMVTVVLFGLANLFADGAAMGLGSFLSLRAEQSVYQFARKKEAPEARGFLGKSAYSCYIACLQLYDEARSSKRGLVSA